MSGSEELTVHPDAESAVKEATPNFKLQQDTESVVSYAGRIVEELATWSKEKFGKLDEDVKNWYEDAVNKLEAMEEEWEGLGDDDDEDDEKG